MAATCPLGHSAKPAPESPAVAERAGSCDSGGAATCPLGHSAKPPPESPAATCPLGHSAKPPPESPAATCPLGHSAKPPESLPGAAGGGGARGEGAGLSGGSSGSSCPVPQAAAGAGTGGAATSLSPERIESTIPSASGEPFLYPSERQFYGSATAKGHQVDPGDMTMVIAIHNAVNERTWQEILRFEHLHAQECATPKLLHFAGRPGELSPKARLLGLIGRTPPFDRHDWHVDRCGTHVRYLVDFYDGKPSPAHPVSIHIDARPELTWAGLRDRLKLWAWGSPLA